MAAGGPSGTRAELTGRAWAIKESLRRFWTYGYAKNAREYFRRWYFWATHSRLAPIIKAAKTLIDTCPIS